VITAWNSPWLGETDAKLIPMLPMLQVANMVCLDEDCVKHDWTDVTTEPPILAGRFVVWAFKTFLHGKSIVL
jgi:hypothetical protein